MLELITNCVLNSKPQQQKYYKLQEMLQCADEPLLSTPTSATYKVVPGILS